MERDYSEEKRYLRAKKKVDNLKGFYSNILSYCIVIPFLVFINLKFTPGFQWFWFPMIGWGIGLAFHGFGVFGNDILFGKDWEERKINEYMNRNDNNF